MRPLGVYEGERRRPELSLGGLYGLKGKVCVCICLRRVCVCVWVACVRHLWLHLCVCVSHVALEGKPKASG